MAEIKKKSLNERIKGILINISLLFLTLILCFILLEIFLRIFLPQNLNYAEFDLKNGEGYRLRSNFHGVYTTPEYTFDVKTNANGFRDERDFKYEKPQNVKRILVLGDSLVFGYTVGINESYPERLERMLNSQGINAEVINTGVPSYSTYKELMYFKNELYKYNPDIVILGLCIGNDIFANADDEENTKHVTDVLKTKKPFNEYFNLRLRRFASSNFHSFQFIRGVLISNDNIKRFFTKIGMISGAAEFASHYEEYVPFINEDLSEDISMNKTLQFIRELNDFTNQKGMEMILLPIPVREQVDPEYYKEFWKTYENYSTDIERPEKYFEEISMKENITYIDPLQALRENNADNSLYWKIDAHLNARGYNVLAELTSERLIKDSSLR